MMFTAYINLLIESVEAWTSRNRLVCLSACEVLETFVVSVKGLGRYPDMDDMDYNSWGWSSLIRGFIFGLPTTTQTIHVIFQAAEEAEEEGIMGRFRSNISKVPWGDVGYALRSLPCLRCLTCHVTGQSNYHIWEDSDRALESGIRNEIAQGFETHEGRALSPMPWTIDSRCFPTIRR